MRVRDCERVADQYSFITGSDVILVVIRERVRLESLWKLVTTSYGSRADSINNITSHCGHRFQYVPKCSSSSSGWILRGSSSNSANFILNQSWDSVLIMCWTFVSVTPVTCVLQLQVSGCRVRRFTFALLLWVTEEIHPGKFLCGRKFLDWLIKCGESTKTMPFPEKTVVVEILDILKVKLLIVCSRLPRYGESDSWRVYWGTRKFFSDH